jgi:hypothetical protein
MTPTDIIGYAAMAVLMISFLLKDLTKLRLVNTVACTLFVFYGFMLATVSYPIIISNSFIICVNIFYLIKAKNSKQ